MASATTLSRNDRSVLSALFDAEGMPSQDPEVQIASSALPGFTLETLRELQHQEAAIIKRLNVESPLRQDIEDSIARLSQLIDAHPEYPSAYNNRAQAVKLLLGDDLFDAATATSSLYSDLSRAITLASPAQTADYNTTANANTTPSVSPTQSRILSSAYTHRGHLLYKASRTLSQSDSRSIGKNLPGELRGLDAGRLEKMAAADFRLGGKYGNDVARQMAVRLNPYAKLCGEIVREAMVNDMRESMAVPLVRE